MPCITRMDCLWFASCARLSARLRLAHEKGARNAALWLHHRCISGGPLYPHLSHTPELNYCSRHNYSTLLAQGSAAPIFLAVTSEKTSSVALEPVRRRFSEVTAALFPHCASVAVLTLTAPAALLLQQPLEAAADCPPWLSGASGSVSAVHFGPSPPPSLSPSLTCSSVRHRGLCLTAGHYNSIKRWSTCLLLAGLVFDLDHTRCHRSRLVVSRLRLLKRPPSALSRALVHHYILDLDFWPRTCIA
ncbi:hypothetical protein BCV70DRAFT_7640 [Testicularia cyperi]|uniref:Uncharacterized protein n=1 Tax=Testicularia cyperi TaxID=1882483 RepID=A0A317XX27_9BASI|nr:hypothetical protein BCV70DRAFT_7640 [Testicularia cyperi]